MLKSPSDGLWSVLDWCSYMGAFIHFLNLSSKVLAHSPMCHHHSPTSYIRTYMSLHSFVSLCPSPWVPLRCSLMFCHIWNKPVLHIFLMFLMLLYRPWVYGMTVCPLYLFGGSVLFWLIVVLLFVCLWYRFCILFNAHLGYLHWVSASCRCCSSVSRSSGV